MSRPIPVLLTLGLAACHPEDPACAPYEAYGEFPDTQVTLFASFEGPEGAAYESAWAQFETCTGTDVVYEFSGNFEEVLAVRIDGGVPPDVTLLPQPGAIREYAAAGVLVGAPEGAVANVEAYWSEGWAAYGTVDGTLYGTPLGAGVKSLVWYSPTTFAANSYAIPTTWEEMMALSDQMVVDGLKPWCGGIESGDSTGWLATDWLEQIVLREHGGAAYDRWVSHDLLFDSTEIRGSLATLDGWMRNEVYVNGGWGDSTTIADVSIVDGGLPILEGDCGMFQQASWWSLFPAEDGATVGPDGDVFAFYLPPMADSEPTPVVGGGDFVLGFSDRPEVDAFREYLSSVEFATTKAELGGWVSANSGVDPAVYADDPVSQLSAEILADPDGTFRFDASDIMPVEIGTGAFWEEMTAFFADHQDIVTTVQAIDAAWPSP